MCVSVPRGLSAVVARPHRTAAAILATIACAGAASAAISTFDSSAEGWSASFGAATWENSDGHPGGYLRLEAQTPPASPIAAASPIFYGDQSQMLGGAFGLDARILVLPFSLASNPDPLFNVSVTISNGPNRSGAATHVFSNAARLSDGWVSLSAALVGAQWGVSDATLLGILGGVSDITVRVTNATFSPPLVFGLDNVGFIPTPGAAALFAIAGLVALTNRRR